MATVITAHPEEAMGKDTTRGHHTGEPQGFPSPGASDRLECEGGSAPVFMPLSEEMKSEILRKTLHMVVVLAFIPIAAISKGTLVLIIVLGLIFYLFYESYVQNGGTVPWFTRLVDKIKRLREREITHAPFLMGAGVISSVLIFPFTPATAGLLQLAFSDMASTLVGKRWGKRHLPHAPEKTLEGSLGFLVTAFVMMLFLYPVSVALLLAVAGAAIESLPYKDWDNFFIPVGVSALASFF